MLGFLTEGAVLIHTIHHLSVYFCNYAFPEVFLGDMDLSLPFQLLRGSYG